jgi:hypothetical protein
VIRHFTADRVHREDVVVDHVVLVAVIVEQDRCLAVVRRVNAQAPLENMGGRVGGVQVGDQRGVGHSIVLFVDQGLLSCLEPSPPGPLSLRRERGPGGEGSKELALVARTAIPVH